MNKHKKKYFASKIYIIAPIIIVVIGMIFLLSQNKTTPPTSPLTLVANDTSYNAKGKMDVKGISFQKNSPDVTITDSKTSIALAYIDEDDNTSTSSSTLSSNSESITYSIKPDINLRYTPLSNGIKEEVIIDKIEAVKNNPQVSYSFALNLEGFDVTMSEDGYADHTFVSKSDPNITYSIPPAFMKDAKGITSNNVELVIKKGTKEGEYTAILTPDTTWMVDKAREYPIIIDPTIVRGAAPYSYWKFDEGYGTTAQDYSTNNKDVTLAASTATPTWLAKDSCVSEKCLRFDGSNDYASTALDLSSTDAITVEFWMKWYAYTNDDDVAMEFTDNYNTHTTGFLVLPNASNGAGDKFYFSSKGDGGGSVIYFNRPSANAWHHYAFVADRSPAGGTGDTVLAYVDGVIAPGFTEDAVSGNNNNFGNDTLYFMSRAGSSLFGNGELDEVKIYPYVRTALQIRQDYISRSTLYGVAAQFGDSDLGRILSNGLTGYWKTDESSGNALDSSGNSVTLTNNGTTPYSAGKFGNAPTFNGSSMYLSTATSLSGVKSVSFWAKPSATTDNYIHLASGIYINSSSGTITATGFASPKIYVNGIASSTIAASSWQFVTITTETGITANAFEIGRANGAYAVNNSQIDDIRIYNRTFSPSEIQKLYEYAPGPVGYWKMDEKSGSETNDSSGYANNCTFSSMPTLPWTIGKFGSALDFQKTNDIVNCGSAAVLDDLPTMTVSAWIYPHTSSTWMQIVDKSSDGTPSDGWIFETNGATNSLEFWQAVSGGAIIRAATGVLTPNTWQYVTVTWDGVPTAATGIKLYVNGLETTYTTTTVPGGTPTRNTDNTQPLVIGNSVDLGDDYDGYIDDVKVYNYIRSSGQVIEDMNGGHPVGGSPIGSQVAYWKLNEMQGTTAYDWSPNTNNLTLSSASWTTSGKFGGAWNGTGGAIRMSRPSDPDLEFGTSDDFSLSFWFKSDSATNPASAIEYLVSDTTGNTDAGYSVYLNTDGTLCFGIDDDTSWGPDVSSCTPNDVYDGLWHHVTAIRDHTSTDKLYVYIDTVLKDSDTDTTTATLDGDNIFYIGDIDNDDAAANEEFAGDIDEFKVYRAALTPDQVKTEFNQGKAIVMGSLSANSSNVPQNSREWSYCPPGSAASCTGPLHEYMMNENGGTTVYDTGNAAALYNGTHTFGSTFTTGKFGSGALFDGVDSYISVGANQLYEETEAFTISAWINPKTLSNNPQIVCHDGDDYTCFEIDSTGWAGVTNGLVYCSNGGCATIGKSMNNVITTNTWQHVVMTYNGTNTCQFYVNGINVTSSATCSEAGSGYTTVIGGVTAGAGNSLNGSIDLVRTYDYVRTPAQIAWEFNRGAPVAWYKFDECTDTVINDWGPNGNGGFNGNTGTLNLGAAPASGTCTTSGAWFNGANGKINASMDFDGTDDYVSVTDNDKLDIASSFGISAWINPDTVNGSGEHTVVHKGEGSSSDYYLSINNGYLSMGFFQSSDWRTLEDTTTPIVAGNWYHVSGVFDDDNNLFSLYINGKLVKTGSVTYSPPANAYRLLIGAGYTGSEYTNLFDGKLDDIRIFNYAPSVQQVRDTYNNGAVSFK